MQRIVYLQRAVSISSQVKPANTVTLNTSCTLTAANACVHVHPPVCVPLWVLWPHPSSLPGWFPGSPRWSWSPFWLSLWRLLLQPLHSLPLTSFSWGHSLISPKISGDQILCSPRCHFAEAFSFSPALPCTFSSAFPFFLAPTLVPGRRQVATASAVYPPPGMRNRAQQEK